MALFGSSDKDIKLMTRVLQVNPDDQWEVQQFIGTMVNWNHAADSRTVCEMQDLLRLAQRVAKTLREEQGIYESQEADILSMYTRIGNTYRGAAAISTPAAVPNEKTDRLIPAEQIRFSLASDDPVVNLFLQIVKEVMALRENYQRLRICEECKLPYMADIRREDQHYCSRRCAARAGERRRRAERKAKKEFSHAA